MGYVNIMEFNPNISEDGSVLYSVNIPNTVTDILIPATVKFIESNCFIHNKIIRNVIIENAMCIAAYAFYNCSKLRSVIASGELGLIGDYAFAKCKRLEYISIPDNALIRSGAFMQCASLTSFNIPNKLDCIEPKTFAMTTSLKSITIPDNVKRIEMDAFKGSGLEHVKIGKNVFHIGDKAFANTNISEIILPDSVEYLGFGCFQTTKKLKKLSILYDPQTSPIAKYPKLKEIPAYCFRNSGLSGQLKLQSGITTIHEKAFCDCESLESIIIPTTVTDIKNKAFMNCSSKFRIHISTQDKVPVHSINIADNAIEWLQYFNVINTSKKNKKTSSNQKPDDGWFS